MGLDPICLHEPSIYSSANMARERTSMVTLARAGAAALVIALVAACHGGGGDTTGASPTSGQQFIVTPANVGFAAQGTGSPTPASRSLPAAGRGPSRRRT